MDKLANDEVRQKELAELRQRAKQMEKELSAMMERVERLQKTVEALITDKDAGRRQSARPKQP